jgi:hypothetical protein
MPPPEPSSNVKFEIGHVLFIDIIGYSKLLVNEQHAAVEEPNQIAREECSVIARGRCCAKRTTCFQFLGKIE